MQVSLDVSNLFNRYDYSSIAGETYGHYLGQGHNAMLTLRAAD